MSEIKKPLEPKEKKIKISLKEIPSIKKEKPKKYKDSGDKQKRIEPSIIAPPMPKGSQLKKIINKPPIKYEPNKQVEKTKLNPKPKSVKPKSKPKIEPLPPQKPYIVLMENNISKKEPLDPLYAMLSQDRSSQEELQKETKAHSGSSINQDIQKLYGDEFGKLTIGQQKYIMDNREVMRRITQQVLTRVARVNLARDLNINKSNVIEFYLHPNGDMSDFKFLEKSGYYILDDTTKETIEYAYSRYPRPTEKTLIRYNVFYNLARY